MELPKGHDVAGGLLDPVPAGDAEVEHAAGDIGRDLLRAEDADLVDTGLPPGNIALRPEPELAVVPSPHGDGVTLIGAPCPFDLDGDSSVGITDLLELLANWGNPWGITDLLALLASWGECG